MSFLSAIHTSVCTANVFCNFTASNITDVFTAPMCLICFEADVPALTWSSCSYATDRQYTMRSQLMFKHYRVQTEV